MNKFKIGDKVRVKDFQAVKDDFSLPDMGDSELVEQTDKKTAFLSKLKALLAKYDASIYAHPIDKSREPLLQMELFTGFERIKTISPCCDLSARCFKNDKDKRI